MTTKRKTLRFAGTVAVAALFVAANEASGQLLRETTDVIIAKRCAADAKLVSETGIAAGASSILSLRKCDRSGPPALARAWLQPTRDTAVLGALFVSSVDVIDRRLIKQLMIVARDSTRSFEERFGAIGTLGHFLDPKRYVSFVRDGSTPGVARVGISSRFDNSIRKGEQSATPEDLEDIRLFLIAIEKAPGDFELRSLAQLFTHN